MENRGVKLRDVCRKKKWTLMATLLVLAAARLWEQQAVEISTVPAEDEAPKLALTFDDGPHPLYTRQLSRALSERGIRASFFLLGERIEGNEAVVQQLKEDGHLICSHGYRHVELTAIPTEEACEQVFRSCKLIAEVVGEYPGYIRPPYGSWSAELDDAMTIIPVFWTVDSLDWELRNTDAVVRRVLGQVKEGDIILLHDCYATTVQATLRLAELLVENGYKFVTVDELVCE